MSIFDRGTFVFHVLNCLSVTTFVTVCKCTKDKINMQAFCKLFLKIFFKFFCGTPCGTFYKVLKCFTWNIVKIIFTFHVEHFVEHC